MIDLIAAFAQASLDRFRRNDGTDRYPAAEMLRDRDDIGCDALLLLECVRRAELRKTGLRLIEHQQHPALVALFFYLFHPAGRRLDDPSGAEQRLGDDGSLMPRRFGVEKLEARIDAGDLAFGKRLADRAAITIRREHRVGTGRKRSDLVAPTGMRNGTWHFGKAVVARVRAHDLVAVRCFFGHGHRRFNRFTARTVEDALLQRRRCNLSEPRREHDLVNAIERVAGIADRLRRLGDRLCYPWMIVPECRAHLA